MKKLKHLAIIVALIFAQTIQIYAQCSSTATLLGGKTVCSGINSDSVYLHSYTGSVIRWESSASGNDPWTTIANTNKVLKYENIVTSSYFRAVIQTGTCSIGVSNSVLITVNPASIGGFVTGSCNVCSGANSGTLTLSGFTGAIQKWQSSPDGINWTDITQTTVTYNFVNLTATTKFRAVVKSGICAEANSTEAIVTVFPVPVANFNHTGSCEGINTVFTDQSTISQGQIVNYSWDFGDASGSTVKDPFHIFQNARYFDIKLNVVSDRGCQSATIKTITINPKPVVNFSVVDVCLRFPAVFTNMSFVPGGSISSQIWDFGDNSSVNSQTSPSYTYQANGRFEPKLVVASNHGCKDSLIIPVNIHPRAIPDFNYTNVCKGEKMGFSNNSQIAEGNLIYFWNFGDGNTSSSFSPEHLYTNDGSYLASLITYSSQGCYDTIQKTVFVHPQPIAKLHVENGCFGTITNFIDSSTVSLGGLQYLWDFGEGSFSTLKNSSFEYPAPGFYLVRLNVKSDSGCVSEDRKVLEILSLPKVSFSKQDLCIGDSAYFKNTSTPDNPSVNYLWDFGNTYSSTIKNPVHLFDLPGTYEVKLILKSGLCMDSASQTITVNPLPAPDFSFVNVCDGFPHQFTNNSSISQGYIMSTTWDFGDGTNSIQQNPLKQYFNRGSYMVTLQLVSNEGCYNELKKITEVYEKPLADFRAENVCFGFPVQFQNNSTISSGGLTYLWEIYDTNTSVLPNPQFVFPQANIYKIKLKAFSVNNCVDSLIRYVQIYKSLKAFAGDDISISKGFPVQLNASGGTVYEWSPSDGLSNPFIPDPLASPEKTTTYHLIVTDIEGCQSYDTLTITVSDDMKLVVMNILTPDGNGKNDKWVIRNIESYPDAKVYVYDRWGSEVFFTENYQNDWTGMNKNNDILSDGTYYYVIEFPEMSKVYKGALTILRNK